jgi:hypothetical protein
MLSPDRQCFVMKVQAGASEKVFGFENGSVLLKTCRQFTQPMSSQISFVSTDRERRCARRARAASKSSSLVMGQSESLELERKRMYGAMSKSIVVPLAL